MTTPGSAPAEDHATPSPAGGLDQFARGIMSGRERGVRASAVRAALSAAEPFYAAAAASRNWLFDSGLKKSHRLPRPVISVGNITTGGTGKTPVVRWLAERLRDHGRRAAVVARGYGSTPGELGDEQVMLDALLNGGQVAGRVHVVASPDRLAAAGRLLRDRPDVDVLILDDGFQHRRVARDLDLVLVSATSPFGYDHVLPRGMLREPLSGLRRAGAVVVTHADQVAPADLASILARLRGIHPGVPVYRATHAPDSVHTPAGDRLPPDELAGRSWFAACGIGDPQVFLRQLQAVGGRCAGYRWFSDHHSYSAADLDDLRKAARAAKADVLVTTEKDWAKLGALPSARDGGPPVWRVDVRVRFAEGDEAPLWAQVVAALSSRAE